MPVPSDEAFSFKSHHRGISWITVFRFDLEGNGIAEPQGTSLKVM
jgi:hypothetical protein